MSSMRTPLRDSSAGGISSSKHSCSDVRSGLQSATCLTRCRGHDSAQVHSWLQQALERRTMQQRVGGVDELHAHALQGLLCWWDVQQVQDDGLVWPQRCASRNLWRQCIADLTCGDTQASQQGQGAMRWPALMMNLDCMLWCQVAGAPASCLAACPALRPRKCQTSCLLHCSEVRCLHAQMA